MPLGVTDRDLDVDVIAPGGNAPGLILHFVQLVGENFERDGPVGNGHEDLVREENPELACVTLLDHGVKVGVWDWVERQPYWTPL